MIKKNLFFAILIPVLAGLSFMAFSPSSQDINVSDENAKVIIEDPEHDFGTIKEDAGSVTAVFKVTNNTSEAIVLTSVRASCGCTTPNWTKEPIEPGKTGEITATFSPKGRPGPFTKTITATLNTNEKLIMHIKGIVE
jgi:hypothetical protein